MTKFHITTSTKQPRSWWSVFTDTLFCPKCGGGHLGRYPEIEQTCPDCGYRGLGFIAKRARFVSMSVWYKPWTWGSDKLEVVE